jgi:hypothetical protein
MATQIVQVKEVIPWLVIWACRAHTRHFCSAFAALVGPEQNIFSSLHYFNAFVPIAHPARQAAVLDSLWLSICLWAYPIPPYKSI